MATEALRMLLLGCRSFDERVVRAQYSSSTSLLDHDVVLWEPETILDEFHSASPYRLFRGLPSLDEDESFSLDRAVKHRAAEMKSFLALGRTLIVAVPAPQSWYVDTGERRTSGTGRNQKVTKIVNDMHLEEVFPFAISLTSATGDEIELKLGDPFATFWRTQRERIYYSAFMEAPSGTVALTIRGTDNAIASIVKVAKGTIVLIPTIWWPELSEGEEAHEAGAVSEDSRRAMDEGLTNALLQLAAELRTETGEYSLPSWAEVTQLPREEARRDKVRALESKLTQLEASLDAARAEAKTLEERKLLFTGSGAALEHLVERAFSALGFSVEAGVAGRTDRILRVGEAIAVLEIKGKSKSAAEKDAAQLEKWVATRVAEGGEPPKAILVVNAWRDTPLSARDSKTAFPEQMVPYARGRGHCLMTGLQLLCAWLEVEQHPERAPEIASGIMETVGVYEGYGDWRATISEEVIATVEGSPS